MKIFVAALTTLSLASTVSAAPTPYGRLNLSLQYTDDADLDGGSELKNNFSRLGLRGTQALEGAPFEVVYQVEFEVQADDGDKGGRTLTERNTFLGVKGDFGTLRAGKFDSPLKVSQNRIDLFNDLDPDMNNSITDNDQRPSNITAYTSPKLGAFTLELAAISAEDDAAKDGVSSAVRFEQNGLYIAAAFDKNVAAQNRDAGRIVVQYTFASWQIGGLLEREDTEGEDAVDGWLLSGQYALSKWRFKAQTGRSDIIAEDTESYALGVDYVFSQQFKTFSFVSNSQYDEGAGEQSNGYFAVGAEYRF